MNNKAELWANNRFGFVTSGRLGRFPPRFVFNLAVFWIMQWGGALDRDGTASAGGTAAALAMPPAFLTAGEGAFFRKTDIPGRLRAIAARTAAGIPTDLPEQPSRDLPRVAAGGRHFRSDNRVLTEGN